MRDHVAVLGGGVGGMSAAHELIERGFRVTVYEKGAAPGGKARSFGMPNTGVNGRRDLPAEHGFRFFPGFYRHLPDTMMRIPYGKGGRSVFHNLVGTTEMQLLFQGRRNVVVPSRFPRSLGDVESVLNASGYLTTSVGLTLDDIQFYTGQVWRLLTSCEERRAEELEDKSWWKYICAEDRSDAYKAYLGRTPRVLVAADPKVANTKTVGDILVQVLFNLADPGVAADRVLNGPTSDVWIGPWLKYLQGCGVDYRFNATAIGFRCVENRIAAVRIRSNGREKEETADHYVSALPVEKMARLIDRSVLDIDPSLEGIRTLAGHVDWMNGIQFYLRHEAGSIYGHQMYLSSEWALTSLSQAQFWGESSTSFTRTYGDGTVSTVLSVDVSDWRKTRGRNGKLAIDCTPREVAREVWEQLKASLPGLRDQDLHPKNPWCLDPAIQPSRGRLTNAEPLLVNRPNSWALRPWAQTRIPNLFLASDYVRTYTNLATMEAANEAARRAVNGIIDASGVRVSPCQVWDLHEPLWVKPWRAWDLYRHRKGRPWAAEIPEWVDAAARAVLETAPSVGGPDDYADFTAREAIEGGIGTVPLYVQQEVVDLVIDAGSALGRGDVAPLRTMFSLDAVVVLGAERTAAIPWLDILAEFFARGGRMNIDIQRLESMRTEGRNVVARFAADLSAAGDHSPSLGRSGRLQLTLARSPDVERSDVAHSWQIAGLTYATDSSAM